MEKKKLDRNETIKRLMIYIKPYWIYVFGSLLFAAVSVPLTLYILSLIGKAVDCIVRTGGVDFTGLKHIISRMSVIIVLIGIFQWIMNLCNNKIVYNVIKDLRKDAFSKIQILPLKYIDKNSYGDIVSKVIADVDQLADGLLLGFTQFFTGVVTILGTLIFMFYESVPIAIVVVVLTPASLFVAGFIARKTYSMFKFQSETRGKQTAFIDETIGNQKVVQAYGHEGEAIKKFDEINGVLEKSSLYAIFFSSITNPATRFINGLVYSGVGVTGAILVIKGSLTVGVLTAFLNYANQYTKPFNEISGVVTELQNAFACAGRILELIDEKPQSPEKENAIELTNIQGEVVLKDVEFSYSKDRKLIENLNLTAKPGQKIAIVGPTGCGKTTIINLLMRFYDIDSGSIEVDGHNIKDVTRKSIRTNYGMVLQDTWLKTGTIRENICMGKPDASEEEMIEAAKAARAHSFIMRMPDGYDTVIADNGEGMSQGQKQLLCIARVMLSLPSILILDEATSSIDTRTEIKIQEAFMTMMEGRTSFIIAHRLSTIKEADTILVMKDGHIIEQGKHNELLKRKGFYYELYNSQFVQEAI